MNSNNNQKKKVGAKTFLPILILYGIGFYITTAYKHDIGIWSLIGYIMILISSVASIVIMVRMLKQLNNK